MEKIIVPTDFSEESCKGLELAIVYANHFKCDIQMVFVIRKRNSKFYLIEYDRIYEAALEEFETMVRKYKKCLKSGCELTYIIKTGNIHEEVARQAEAFDDSLIISSTSGDSGVSEFFIGSNVHKIIHETKCPVITVTKDKPIACVDKIVMPLDISKETREKIPYTAQIAKAFDAEVHILGVSSSKSKSIQNKLRIYCEQAKNYFEQHGIKYQTSTLVGENITDITIEYAESVNAKLIAIMTEQTTTIMNIFWGSYAYQMLNKSPIPVLSITANDLFRVR